MAKDPLWLGPLRGAGGINVADQIRKTEIGKLTVLSEFLLETREPLSWGAGRNVFWHIQIELEESNLSQVVANIISP